MLANLKTPQHHIGFQEQSITVQPNSSSTLNLNFDSVSKGIFLDNVKKDSLKNVQLILNGFIRFDYDDDILNDLCQQIGDDCLYIPFDCKPFDTDDWNGSLNYSRISNVSLVIRSNVQQSISVKSICSNKFTNGILHYVIGYYCGVTINNQPFVPAPVPTVTYKPSSREIFKFLTTLIKENLEDNTLCPIESEIIKKGDKYVKCGKCTGIFLKENIDIWFKTHVKCPICFVKWSNDKVYLNIN